MRVFKSPVADWWLVLGLAVSVLVVPLFAVDVPPVLDYPNHLARAVVLAAGQTDPVLSRFYRVQWGIIPNLGVDVLLPGLLHLLPVHVAGRIALGVALLLPFAGGLAYHRALFGPWRLWPIGGALVACNSLFLLGFLNCLLSAGLALGLASVWVRGRGRWPVRTAMVCAAGSACLFFCHLLGVGLFALLAAAHEVAGLRGRPLVRGSLASAGLLAATLAPAGMLYWASAFNAQSSPAAWLPPAEKLIGLLGPVQNYDPRLDLLTAMLLSAFIAWCAWRGWLAVPASSLAAGAVLLSLYAVAPFTAKGGAWLDARFVVLAGFLLFAGCVPRNLPRRLGLAAFVCAAGLLLVRTGVVASAWAEHASDLRELRASIAAVQPGERVLAVRVSPEANPAFWAHAPRSRHIEGSTTTEIHDAALLLIERRAFWPLLFANPAQQPVAVRDAFQPLSAQLGTPPDTRALYRPSARDLQRAPYLQDWQTHFDAVLVLDAEGAPDLAARLPGVLRRVNDTGFAALYRVMPGWAEHPRQSVSADAR